VGCICIRDGLQAENHCFRHTSEPSQTIALLHYSSLYGIKCIYCCIYLFLKNILQKKHVLCFAEERESHTDLDVMRVKLWWHFHFWVNYSIKTCLDSWPMLSFVHLQYVRSWEWAIDFGLRMVHLQAKTLWMR